MTKEHIQLLIAGGEGSSLGSTVMFKQVDHQVFARTTVCSLPWRS